MDGEISHFPTEINQPNIFIYGILFMSLHDKLEDSDASAVNMSLTAEL
jgi:hypothetical protein